MLEILQKSGSFWASPNPFRQRMPNLPPFFPPPLLLCLLSTTLFSAAPNTGPGVMSQTSRSFSRGTPPHGPSFRCNFVRRVFEQSGVVSFLLHLYDMIGSSYSSDFLSNKRQPRHLVLCCFLPFPSAAFSHLGEKGRRFLFEPEKD